MFYRPWPVLVLCVAVLVCATGARAEDLDPATNPALSTDTVALDARAEELERALADVQRPTRMYFAGWLTTLSALGVGQGLAGWLIDMPPGQQESMYLGAALSVLGVGIQLVTPYPGRYGADEMRGMPSSTLADKRKKVARGEELLEGEADSAWFQRAWFQHIVIAAAGAGVGLFLGLRHPDEVWTAAVPAAIGTFVVGDAQIWTRPKAAISHWERYRAHLNVAPSVAANGTGAGFVLHGRF